MEEEISQFCEIHLTEYYECDYENCNKTQICKICVLESKDTLKHLYDHFDNIKIKKQHKYEKLKEIEEYKELNSILNSFLENSGSFSEQAFTSVIRSRGQMANAIRTALIDKYEKVTEEFESFVRQLRVKVETLDPKNKNVLLEVIEMKKTLDEKTKFFTTPDLIKDEFRILIDKIEKKMRNYKLQNYLEGKVSFSLKYLKGNLDWIGLNSNLVTTSSANNNGSYWCVKSVEVLEGQFEAKLRVISITSPSSMWNYGFGIIRENSNQDGSYYNDSICLYSSGSINSPFSGSGGTNYFTNFWKSEDIIFIMRDSDSNIHFAINDESTYIKVADNRQGNFRIVLGFSSSVSNNGDSFELVELNKN